MDDDDRLFFLKRLRDYAQRYSMCIHAYCLMSNHVHLLVEVESTPVSKPMQGLLQSHAQYINRRHGHRGHLFGDRFWSKTCLRDTYLLELLRDIHLNPVRAGLVVGPELYRWCSHTVYLGSASRPWITTELLWMFSRDQKSAVREYMHFIEDAMPPRFEDRTYE